MAGKKSWTRVGEVDSSTTIFSDDRVEESQAYQYHIRAVNAEGMSDALQTEEVCAGEPIDESFIIIKTTSKNFQHVCAKETEERVEKSFRVPEVIIITIIVLIIIHFLIIIITVIKIIISLSITPPLPDTLLFLHLLHLKTFPLPCFTYPEPPGTASQPQVSNLSKDTMTVHFWATS